MKKKTFTLLASLLAVCAVMTTAAFAVTEQSWFRTDIGTGFSTLSASPAELLQHGTND